MGLCDDWTENRYRVGENGGYFFLIDSHTQRASNDYECLADLIMAYANDKIEWSD